jgi:lipid biosynthesis B12-binding/radical SAM protein
MSKILLISANIETEPYPVYPLGMSMVATSLTENGHDALQFDMLTSSNPERELAALLSSFKPDCAGISLRNIDNVDSLTSKEHWSLKRLRELVSFIKSHVAIPVILGGAGFSLIPDAILAYVRADHGVVGEGEEAMVDILRLLENGETPPRILRAKRRLHGDEIAGPKLDPIMFKAYAERSGLTGVQTKRGCLNACSYCTYPLLEGTGLRVRPPEAVVEEIERLTLDYGIRDIVFTDSVFNDACGHYLEVAEALVRKDLGVKWSAFFKPSDMRPDELDLLCRSGLMAAELGTDASSNATLAGLQKGFTFEDATCFNALFVSRGVPCAHFIIFGGPNETCGTLKEGLANIECLPPCVVFAFSGIRIHPGTALHERALAEGIILKTDTLLEPTFYHSSALNQQDMNARIEAAFKSRRDRIFPPDKGQKQLAVLHRFGYRGILWDTLMTVNSRRIALKNQPSGGRLIG